MKILLIWVGLITTVKGIKFQNFVESFIKQDQGTSRHLTDVGSGRSQPCGTDLLTCVPDFDCNPRDYSGAKICPPFFQKIGGACYFRSNDITVKDRTRPDALKFCQALGGNLLFIESEEEFNKLSAHIEKGIPYWTEGFYTPKKGGSYALKETWVWESSINKKIEFKLVHPDSGKLEEIKEPRDNLCLSINDTGLYPTSCLLQNPFVCKEGHYDNICERFESHKCCFTPSYDYYIKNHLKDREAIGTNEAIGTKSQCFVTYNTQTVTCAKAYKALESIPAMNFRFENTIYYTMPADEGCGKNTEGVVYSKDLHTTFVRIFSLLENLNIKFRIGLRGIETPTEIKFKWANGRYVDFYEDTYWAPGHPQSQKTTCVMYALTGEGGSYLWQTEEKESVCNDPNNFVVCQLPIRSHDYKPNLKEEGCGERKSRGVLGRSLSFSNADETNFGELPWQTAISIPSFYEDSGFKFVCSGVLISYDSVITSAHCALQRGDSMVVSLGDYDLKQGQKRRKLLYPEFRAVEERIIHPDYRIRPRKNDIAILRLSKSVNYNKFPHIGIACLPTHNLVYGDGNWECYVTGWPAPKGYEGSRSHSQVLSRIEVDFTSRDKCDDANSKLSTRPHYQYYGSHGRRAFERYGTNRFLCVEAWDDGSCIDDNTAMLFCKRTADYLDDPFSRDSYYDGSSISDGLYGSGGQQYGVLQEWIKSSTNIINSNAQERSDNDRWYLLGIGLGGRCDRSSDIMLFEPVHEHMAFIHTNVNLAEQE